MLRMEFMNNSCVPLVLSSLRWKAAKPSAWSFMVIRVEK